MTSCPTIEQIERLAAGEMGEHEAAQVQSHLESCPSCRKQHDRCSANRAFAAQLRDALTVPRAKPPPHPSQGRPANLPTQGGHSARLIEGYEIVRKLRRGGQGVVYEAIQQTTRRRVALKVLLGGTFSTEKTKQRFEREVRIVAGLRHPNIAQVYESGIHQGRYWFSMEYVDGRPVDQVMKAEKLTIGQRLAVMAKTCEAVGYAHEHNVIHRDLKPSNILLSADGEPHVVDFGLAKQEESGPETEMTLSVTGVLMGTPAYMSPEQTKRDPSQVDARTDVYSLGVVLYYLVTGHFPYDVRGRLDEVIRNIATAEPTPPSWILREIDSELEAIILRALAKEPEERYSTATEMAADLRRRIAGEPVEAKLASRTYRFKKSLKRFRYHMIGAGVLAAAVIASVLVTRSMVQGKAPDRGLSSRVAITSQSTPPQPLEPLSAAPNTAAAPAPAKDRVAAGEEQAKHGDAGDAGAASSKVKPESPTADKRVKPGDEERRPAAKGVDSVPPAAEPQPSAEPTDSDETRAKALMYQLEGAIQAKSWRAAFEHLEGLKSRYADTSVVRGSADKSAAWERQVREGLKALAVVEEREAQDRLAKLESLVDRKDYLRSQLAFDTLQERFGHTALVKRSAEKLKQLSVRIDSGVKTRHLTTTSQYLVDVSPPTSAQWKKAMEDAKAVASQYKTLKTIFLVRILLEDEGAEAAFGVRGNGVCIFTCCWGHSLLRLVNSGDVVIAGFGGSCYSGQQRVEFGLEVGALYHYSPIIGLDYDEKQGIMIGDTQLVTLGEVVVRSIPPENTGSLIVSVSPEEGGSTAGAKLYISRFLANAYTASGLALDSGGKSVLNGVAAGPCSLSCAGSVTSPRPVSAVIRAGEATEVQIKANAPRTVEFEWLFQADSKSARWRRGVQRVDTGNEWQPDDAWGGVQYPVLSVADYDGEKCMLRPTNCGMAYLGKVEFNEKLTLPQSEISSPHSEGTWEAQEGAVFALYQRSPARKETWTAFIRIREISISDGSAGTDPKARANSKNAGSASSGKDSKKKTGRGSSNSADPKKP